MFEIVEEYKKRDVKICFVKLRYQLKQLFKYAGLIDLIGESNFFQKINSAVASIREGTPISHHGAALEKLSKTSSFSQIDDNQEFVSFSPGDASGSTYAPKNNLV
jgi:hypothetical protein